jgi:hypothetical protein
MSWRSNVAVDTASALPIASTPASGRQAPETTSASEPTRPSAAAAAAPAAPQPLPAPQPIGFTQSYDEATQHIVLEAVEPGSGYVISQVPPGYVLKQFTASIGDIIPARGATVDSSV